ncbi:hypothetical protein Hamer_G025120 [Homarus americanus]|uniref:Uncharacterized protein n=1 Tax=Homarus americanus TaxID=6706 RepID=A0A8J5TKJ8_HOMAM|nr:hypothetical protein Hamer_G025120 [Homarus americanus]
MRKFMEVNISLSLEQRIIPKHYTISKHYVTERAVSFWVRFRMNSPIDLAIPKTSLEWSGIEQECWCSAGKRNTLKAPVGVGEAFAFGVSMFNKQIKLEELLKNRGLSLKRNSSSYDHQVQLGQKSAELSHTEVESPEEL